MVGLALVSSPPLADAQNAWVEGRAATVQLTRQTRVGATTLSPGYYQVQHQIVDGRDYLALQVVSRSFVPGHHSFGAVIDEVARVPCRLLTTGAEQSDTAVYTTAGPDGVPLVTRVVIRGEHGIFFVVPAAQP